MGQTAVLRKLNLAEIFSEAARKTEEAHRQHTLELELLRDKIRQLEADIVATNQLKLDLPRDVDSPLVDDANGTLAIAATASEAMGSIEEAKNINPHTVILVHGIRDFGLWQNEIRDILVECGFFVEPTNYGRFDILRFLLPVPWFRKTATNRISEQIEAVRHMYPDNKISVIAHSFGTYIISRILKEKFHIKFDRVIFCGSVVRYGFPFEQVTNRFSAPLLNEVGSRDIWPALADSVTWGYGSAGTFGFRKPPVRDRWHRDAQHGFFLNAKFCLEYWVPFIERGVIVPGGQAQPPQKWIVLISILKLKYSIWVILLFLFVIFEYFPFLIIFDWIWR